MMTFGFSQQIVSSNQKYIEEIKVFHQNRMDKLKMQNGWLNLVGLFLLQDDKNPFDSNKKYKLIFPKGKSPEFIGNVILYDNQVFV